MSNSADFSKGRTLPMILRFSVPAAAAQLITAVYNIVDRIFIGNCSGNTALAALSICFPLSFLMLAFGLMCSAGGSSQFTLFRGMGKTKEANKTFSTTFMMCVVFELVLMAALLMFSDFFLKIFGVTSTTYDLALQYYRIVALGCVLQGLTFVFCDFVRVSGKPLKGMLVTATGAVTNIVLDGIFVAGLGYGVKGAAIATVIGQLVSTCIGFYMVFGGRTLVKIEKSTFVFVKSIGMKIINCGSAFMIAQLSMAFITLVYNIELGKYGGDVAISVYAVISSIMTFILMPAIGLSQGTQPLIGYNYGSKRYDRVKKIYIQATVLSVGITAVIWGVTELCPVQIIRLFGGGSELMGIGVLALRINFIIAPVLGFVHLATAFFQALGKGLESTIITLLRQVIALVPLILLLPKQFGVNGIFIAQPVSDFLAAILTVILVWKTFKTFNNEEKVQ